MLENLLKDQLLNLAFLITWCCRIAEIEQARGGGMRQGKMYLVCQVRLCPLFFGDCSSLLF